MKRIVAAAVLILTLGLAACGQKEPAAAVEEGGGPAAYMANPWRDITEAEAKELYPRSVRVPDGARNVHWSALGSAADPSGVPGVLVQLKFDLDGNSFTAREQRTDDEDADQAGMYYEWTAQTQGVLKSWGGVACRCYRYVGEDEYADLCIWYDAAAGVSYSVGVAAKDLDGFDLQAVAEALCP